MPAQINYAMTMANKFWLAVCIVGCEAYAQADRVDDYIRREMSQQHIAGCSVAVVKDGHVVKVSSYGEADVTTHRKVTNQTPFQIGSVSKQFEATALMYLSIHKRFDWNVPISAYVANLPEAWKNITGKQLMSHTSGLPDYTDSEDHAKRAGDHVTAREVIDSIRKDPLRFKTGTKFEYCNTGSFLCGLAIQSITKKPYDSFLKELVRRIDMNDTYLRDDRKPDKRASKGYVWDGKKFSTPPKEDSSWPFAGGGVVSNISDLIRWEQYLRRRQMAGISWLAPLWQPTQLVGSGSYPYGLGWQLLDDRGIQNVWHTGHIPGFSSVISRFPTDGYTVIILTNADNIDTLGMAREIAGIYDHDLTPARDLHPKTDPDPARTKRLFDAATDLANNKPSANLTAGIQVATTDSWRQIVKSTTSRMKVEYLGEDDISLDEIERLGSMMYRIVHYRLSFGSISVTEGFYLDRDGKLGFVGDE